MHGADLPRRFQLGAPLNKYDRSTFYTQGSEGAPPACARGRLHWQPPACGGRLHLPLATASAPCPPSLLHTLSSPASPCPSRHAADVSVCAPGPCLAFLQATPTTPPWRRQRRARPSWLPRPTELSACRQGEGPGAWRMACRHDSCLHAMLSGQATPHCTPLLSSLQSTACRASAPHYFSTLLISCLVPALPSLHAPPRHTILFDSELAGV